MSEEHDRYGEFPSPDGAWTEAEPAAGRDAASGPEAGAEADRPDTAPRAETDADPRAESDTARMDLDAMGEDALRHLLRDSVRDIEPSPDALDHLRRAVPARRARRKQVAVGAAAAVLVCSVAVPAMLHADFGSIGDKPMHNAGHAQDHLAEQQKPDSGDQGQGPAGDGEDGGPHGQTDQGAETGAPTVGGSAGPDPSSSLGPVSPTCTRDQLSGKAGHGEADAEGHVYGSFTVVNTSDASCTVEGDGVVLATAQGGAKSTMIEVVDHIAGDEATGLPDPVMTASDEIVLEPNAAYQVRFAWIPREGGGTTGCATSSPSPGGEGGEGTETSGGQQPMGSSESLDDGSSSDTGGTGGTGGTTGSEGGDGTDTGSGDQGGASGGTGSGDTDGSTDGSTGGDGDGDGTAPSATVVVTHTPDVGDPVAGQVEIAGACAGTLYRTGVLPAA